MKNKKMLLRLGLFMMAIGCFSISATSATSFRLNIEKIESLSKTYLTNKIIPIHFADNGNDFGGFFYFSNGIGEDDWGDDGQQEFYGVSIGTSGYECGRQVKGFYYNAERGERLRPLDKETRATGLQQKITTSGGLFTVCSETGFVEMLRKCLSGENNMTYKECESDARSRFPTDGDGYYGQVTNSFSGQEMVLIVGVNYNTNTSKFITIDNTKGFSPSFIRVGNKYPVGFIYDYNGGVGFVGCKVRNTAITGSMKKLINKYNGLLTYGWNGEKVTSPLNKMFIETGDDIDYRDIEIVGYDDLSGNITCSNAVRDSLLGVVIEGIVGMGQSGNMSNFGYIGNEMDKKMQYFSSADINNNTIVNYARKKAELLCRGKWQKYNGGNINTQDSVICVNVVSNTIVQANLNTYNNKTLIVKNGSVAIEPFSSMTDKHYDIFIDSGNLIINEGAGTERFVFNSNGFPVNNNTEGFSGEVHNYGGDYAGDNVAIASLIKGNFIVNGRISGPNGSGLNNKYFIYGKISTRDTFNTLLDTFKWRCKNGIDTNNEVCPLSWKTENDSWRNPYENASLVIIDQNYANSPFFNK